MIIAPHAFDANELWTLGIAAYAALVSTFVLGWDAYKWLASGPKIELTVSTGMIIVGGTTQNQNTYISVTAYNIGDQPTTITNLCGMHFETWWGAYVRRRKPTRAFVINEPSKAQRIPYRFDVGDQWQGLMIQTDDIVCMAQDGYLFLILYTARGGRGTRTRVKWRNKEASTPKKEA
jgi:hypothetical protein